MDEHDKIECQLKKDAYEIGFLSWFGMRITKSNYYLFLADFQSWLRSKHGIDVEVNRSPIQNTLYGKMYSYEIIVSNDEEHGDSTDFTSYDDALEKGLEKVIQLKLVKPV